MSIRLYPLGYILSDEIVKKLPSNYVSQELSHNYFYYIDKGTPYSIYESEDNFLIIHGEYMHIGINNNIPNHKLAEKLLFLYSNNFDEFLNLLDYIAGRFTIIVKEVSSIKIFPDATNARSNYYCTDRILVSSHAFLLADVLDYNIPKGKIKHEHKIFLNTLYDNVKSTISNHYTELMSNKVTRFFPRENNPFSNMDEERKFQLIEKFWKTQIDEFSKYDNKLIFSITGGLNSRFALSLSKEHINNLSFFTYALKEKIDNSNNVSRLLSLDYAIVTDILKDIPLNHKFFYLHDNPKTLTDEESKILNKNTTHSHLPILNKYVEDAFGDNSIHLRSNLLEIGQAHLYRRREVESSSKEAKDSVMRMYKRQTTNTSFLEQLYDEFVSNTDYLSNTYDYHTVDLVYWELRMGRWLCEVYNNHDSILRTINPFNHRALICLSLAFPYEQRRDLYMFKEIINRNYPILNFYGFNNLKNLYEQSKEKRNL
ncbi:hypothetical protein [Aliicoccus persicus]|uniref:Asparagine synthase n=1 Tax=Aliicoccus persicus TaxID=930138 RepID=A0A662Z0J5_9STAP|nr:hypothetical protein [Aliicoccus persicus]SEV79832.1 hypothetical protein SAMN05192557_0030 [Aliicoccus persicus]